MPLGCTQDRRGEESRPRPASSTARSLSARLTHHAAAAAAALAVTWCLALLALPDTVGGRFVDAATYYDAGRAFLSGADPYASFDFRQWPLVAALCAPLALLPPWLALRLWALLSGLAAAIGLWCVHRRLAHESAAPSRLWLWLVALGPPFLTLVALGQMSGLCFAAYAAGLRWLPRHPRLAGLLFAAMAAKPHLALLALPALLAAPAGAGVAFALGSLAWPLGSLLVAGPSGLARFVERLYEARDGADGATLVSVPLSSLLPLDPHAHRALQILLAAALLAALGLMLLARLRRRARLTSAAIDAASAASLAALPYALVSDLLFVAPTLLRLGRAPTRPARALLALWWLLPPLTLLLLAHGGGGLTALIAPAVALTSRRSPREPGERTQVLIGSRGGGAAGEDDSVDVHDMGLGQLKDGPEGDAGGFGGLGRGLVSGS